MSTDTEALRKALTAAYTDEITYLRDRVRTLETQLAQCNCPPAGEYPPLTAAPTHG